jgi:ubiquinone biosynthesis protein
MSISRWRRIWQIYNIFWRYALGDLLVNFLPKRHQRWFKCVQIVHGLVQRQHRHKVLPHRTRLALEELGPVYVKLGQMLSTRIEGLNSTWKDELSLLQSHVQPFSNTEAISIIETELNCTIDTICSHFNPEPIAAASLAQVYQATLTENAAEVVFKVQRPHIRATIDADIQCMLTITPWLEKKYPFVKRLQLQTLLTDYHQTINAELNFIKEAENTQKLRENFLNRPQLYVPKIYPEYCRETILVSEFVKGVPVNAIPELQAQQTDLKRLAETGVDIFFTQVFEDNFFHADMHPGNIFVNVIDPSNPTYIGLDCAIMGTLSEKDKTMLAQCFLAFFKQDYRRIARQFIRQGWVQTSQTNQDFEAAIDTLCRPLFQKPLHEIEFGKFLFALFELAQTYDFYVQPQLVLLQKTLLYVEGLGRQLYPNLNLWETAKPHLEKLIQDESGMKQSLHKAKTHIPQLLDKLPELSELVLQHLQLGSHQKRFFNGLKQQQHLVHKSYYFLISSGILCISTSILWSETSIPIWAKVLLVLSIVSFWWLGWRTRTYISKI